jgi:heat-inducible transcriptional repressor
MLTERQEKLLNFVVKEYIDTAEPVSSLALKKISDLDVSGATIRNDLQELTKQGFIEQPHTSAGRVPTKKAYKYIAEKIDGKATFYDRYEINIVRTSIVRQAKFAHEEMERQIQMMEEIMQTLETDNLFEILNLLDKWHKKI